ncbi:LysM peptidoglycan-binding domain-containing protein [Candidatus Epulonipiscium viviparus]|uniref:LysM peptidoglycan-binding domain-containing protein n=1 Tax=Candidatus Epulonipiscium viviparus TaxID=420336 RepID=UPI00016BFB3B|nr:LysM domain-containing protein [Candidatus Epulopiscium viviparus]
MKKRLNYLSEVKAKRKRNKIIFNTIIALLVIFAIIIIIPNGYMIQVAGHNVGVVESKEVFDESLEVVLAQVRQQYDSDVKLEYMNEVKIFPFKMLNSNKITSNYLITYLREHLGFMIEFRELYAGDTLVGIIESDEMLDDLLSALTIKYYGSDQPSEFVTKLTTKPYFTTTKSLMSFDELVAAAAQSVPAKVEYKVRAGDTLWEIAESLRINRDEITKNNPKIKNGVVVLNSVIEVTIDVPLIDVALTNKNDAREFITYIE